jgi:ABC-2 type transport system ATP-binding protein
VTYALDLGDVHRAFGGRPVLRGVSLRVAPGEAVGLVGLNGAGKTTLLRGLLDLDRIDAGRIAIFGVPHTRTAARAALSYLAERFQPPAFATGRELLRHLLALHGVCYQPGEAEALAGELDLEVAALAQPARHYSKGMAQKLGLIACILPKRPLLVLDEPMSGLDPRARSLFKRCLAARKAAGSALFFSTHQLADVESLCDRMVVLHAGTVIHDGPPAALLAATGAASLEDAFLLSLERVAQ